MPQPPEPPKWLNPGTWLDVLARINAPHKREPVLSPQGLPYAGLNRRLVAIVVDAALLGTLLTPFNPLILAYAYGGVHWDQQAWEATKTLGPEAWRTQWQLVQGSGLANAAGKLAHFQFTVLAVYSFICWHFWGGTPGKLLLRLRVVDVRTGKRLSDWQSVLRLLGYVLAALPLGLGFFAMEWNAKHQGWHDKLAKTAVVALPWRKKAEIKSRPPVADR